MFLMKLFGSTCFLLLLFSCGTSATRTKDRIYDQIYGTASCFRRMNGTHQFGCTSKRSGNVGILELVETDLDLQWLIDQSPLPPYMVVLHMDMFTKPVLIALQNSKKVDGIVLMKNFNTSQNVAHFTHEDTCPNRYSGLSNFEKQECSMLSPWNRDGTSLLMHDWDFPIFYINNQTSIDKIIKCHKQYNSIKEGQEYRSLCAMELSSYMYAAKDSETCIRRSNMYTNLHPVKHCDALGDRNIWMTLFPLDKEQPEPERSVIVLSARMDSASLFDGETPGAGSAVAGLVTAIATFQALASVKDEMKPLAGNRNVLLTLLNGEAYDYIGSSREFIKHMTDRAEEVKINMFTSQVKHLPPASLQTFVKADSKLPGVVVTDHDDHFVNRKVPFNSILLA
ncbi:hypothetical protein B566_EDAN004173 [Ephemera danica]|nr:hypothetical protein B566_EDAN004173 [Ephemera danica]